MRNARLRPRPVRASLAPALLLALAASARSQAPALVLDIEPAPGISSSPGGFAPLGGSVVFHAHSDATGTELWKSDGTAAGTTLLFDVQPGPSGSAPSPMVAFNGELYFSANDGASGVELWKTDGTSGGTVLVRDLVPGGMSSSPSGLTVLGGTLFFEALHPLQGVELWKTNGTSAGTVLVHDFNPGPADSWPTQLCVSNGRLFFAAESASVGRELWTSDGTIAGSVLLADLSPGASGSFPANLVDLAGTLTFNANDGSQGNELWRSDGTPLGTQLIADIRPGPGSSNPALRALREGFLYFAADDGTHGSELWRSDGTAAGTALVLDVRPGPLGSAIARIVALDDELVFVADDGASGLELWRSDGTAAGTFRIADVRPGPASGFVEDPFFPDVEPLAVAGGFALFRADDGASGMEPWRSDGTPAGTLRVADLDPGPAGSNPKAMTPVGTRVFFQAHDALVGTELWAQLAPVGASSCAGDGAVAGALVCPCANHGAPGRGCASSHASAGALLEAGGLAETDEVLLTATALPPTATAIFLQGSSAIPNGLAFGDGLRCTGGFLVMLGLASAVDGVVVHPPPNGPSILTASAAAGDPIAPGATRHYQVYYRDPQLAFCPAPAGDSWNVTNALTIRW